MTAYSVIERGGETEVACQISCPSIASIQEEVARYYGLPLIDLLSARRGRDVARPRQVAMYLAKTLTLCSFPMIGLCFKRDHTTVQHAVRTIESLLWDDLMLAEDIGFLKARLA